MYSTIVADPMTKVTRAQLAAKYRLVLPAVGEDKYSAIAAIIRPTAVFGFISGKPERRVLKIRRLKVQPRITRHEISSVTELKITRTRSDWSLVPRGKGFPMLPPSLLRYEGPLVSAVLRCSLGLILLKTLGALQVLGQMLTCSLKCAYVLRANHLKILR